MNYKILADGREQRISEETCRYQMEKGKHQIELTVTGENLEYVFPGREFVKSKEECEIICNYGTMIPVSFFIILEEKSQSELTIVADTPAFQKVCLKKKEGKVVIVLDYELNSAKEVILLLRMKNGDFHTGISDYRNWYTQKYGRRKGNPFAGKFHLRRYFLHKDLCPCNVLKGDRVTLKEQADEDEKIWGGVDMGLLFDTGYEEKTGIRCGNEQVSYMTDTQTRELARQMKQMEQFFFCILIRG